MGTPLAAKCIDQGPKQSGEKEGVAGESEEGMEARRQEKAATSTKAATKTETGAANKPKRTRLRKKKV